MRAARVIAQGCVSFKASAVPDFICPHCARSKSLTRRQHAYWGYGGQTQSKVISPLVCLPVPPHEGPFGPLQCCIEIEIQSEFAMQPENVRLFLRISIPPDIVSPSDTLRAYGIANARRIRIYLVPPGLCLGAGPNAGSGYGFQQTGYIASRTRGGALARCESGHSSRYTYCLFSPRR